MPKPKTYPAKKAKQALPKPLEADVQKDIVDYLHLIKCKVLITSRTRHPVACATCGTLGWDHEGDKMSRGTPDLLVYRDHWPETVLLGLEVKPHDKARIRPEQQALADAGRIVIVRTIEDAHRAVAAYELTLGAIPAPTTIEQMSRDIRDEIRIETNHEVSSYVQQLAKQHAQGGNA